MKKFPLLLAWLNPLIKSVRYGLANNSSSSHSIIMLPPGVSAESVGDSEDYANANSTIYFGWDFFTAASKEAKARYLIRLIYSCTTFLDHQKKEMAIDIFRRVGITFYEDDDIDEQIPDIDHQSIEFQFPITRDTGTTNREFLNEFIDFMLSDRSLVLGGNDNTDEVHPEASLGDLLNVETLGYVVKDPVYGHWVSFSPYNGTKLRFDFAGYTPIKSSFPELVDLKITDYCPFNCEFCYQGSTEKGTHASMEDIVSAASVLKEMGTFEVAIGGGEPTLHPEFVNILKAFRQFGIVPNFTTKSLGWMRGDQVEEILELCGSFAYSVSSAEEAWEAVDILREVPAFKDRPWVMNQKMSIQYVLGVSPKETFFELLGNFYPIEEVKNPRYIEVKYLNSPSKELRDSLSTHCRLTLLGYKRTGRGDEFTPQDNSGWLEHLRSATMKEYYRGGIIPFNIEYSIPQLCVDTAICEEYGEQFKKLGVSPRLYFTEEGKFSMYWDMVDKKIAPSSYCHSHKEVKYAGMAEREGLAKAVSKIYNTF